MSYDSQGLSFEIEVDDRFSVWVNGVEVADAMADIRIRQAAAVVVLNAVVREMGNSQGDMEREERKKVIRSGGKVAAVQSNGSS